MTQRARNKPAAKLRLKARRRGPACGRRYLVNSTFDAVDCFYRSIYGGSWVGEPRWMGRYRALWRVWRCLRGEDGGCLKAKIDALERVTSEWRRTL